jgi:hypothetical protein
MAKIDLDQLIDIAFAVEQGDPIDWGVFRDGKEQALKMIATTVVEQFDKDLNNDEDRIIVLATITKLIVENMILHTKLLKKTNDEV